jgi:hypothetical protein
MINRPATDFPYRMLGRRLRLSDGVVFTRLLLHLRNRIGSSLARAYFMGGHE